MLAFRLGDMGGIRMQGVTVQCLNIQRYFLASIQTGRQINSVECLLPANFIKLN